jgi:hypothetical protein
MAIMRRFLWEYSDDCQAETSDSGEMKTAHKIREAKHYASLEDRSFFCHECNTNYQQIEKCGKPKPKIPRVRSSASRQLLREQRFVCGPEIAAAESKRLKAEIRTFPIC